MEAKIKAFMDEVKTRNGHEPEFIQAVQEVAETVIPYIAKHEIYNGKNILLRMVEPERLLSFRVAWVDDDGEIHVNRGYRIQMNSAIGPYKGGLRFHPKRRIFARMETHCLFVSKIETAQNLSDTMETRS